MIRIQILSDQYDKSVKNSNEKMSNDQPFVGSNLVRYKLHNIILSPKQFRRNNVRHYT